MAKGDLFGQIQQLLQQNQPGGNSPLGGMTSGPPMSAVHSGMNSLNPGGWGQHAGNGMMNKSSLLNPGGQKMPIQANPSFLPTNIGGGGLAGPNGPIAGPNNTYKPAWSGEAPEAHMGATETAQRAADPFGGLNLPPFETANKMQTMGSLAPSTQMKKKPTAY